MGVDCVFKVRVRLIKGYMSERFGMFSVQARFYYSFMSKNAFLHGKEVKRS